MIASHVANDRYAAQQEARIKRLDAAFKAAPNTGHKPGHKYAK